MTTNHLQTHINRCASFHLVCPMPVSRVQSRNKLVNIFQNQFFLEEKNSGWQYWAWNSRNCLKARKNWPKTCFLSLVCWMWTQVRCDRYLPVDTWSLIWILSVPTHSHSGFTGALPSRQERGFPVPHWTGGDLPALEHHAEGLDMPPAAQRHPAAAAHTLERGWVHHEMPLTGG